MSGRPPIVVLCGPTASGKTALAVALARSLGGEVVSADSQQCYRGLDEGTAKPTAAERALAPHHLLDVAWPEEQLDAAAFVALADRALEDLAARGRPALVVGGTGLWLRALVRGLLEAPGADPAFRAAFRERVAREGLPALHAELARVDPAAAARILPGDRVRIERALEVHAQTGERLSDLQEAHRFAERRHRARVLLLDPPRELLAARIAARTRALVHGVDGGEGPLLREARWLLERCERVPGARKALKIIGYGEAAAALGSGAGPEALAACAERVAARTRQYAKRQRTWFARDAAALDAAGAPLVFSGSEVAGPEGSALLDGLSARLSGWYRGGE